MSCHVQVNDGLIEVRDGNERSASYGMLVDLPMSGPKARDAARRLTELADAAVMVEIDLVSPRQIIAGAKKMSPAEAYILAADLFLTACKMDRDALGRAELGDEAGDPVKVRIAT